jgi:cell division protein FtsI/penicillin-binding protein 2
MWSLQVSDFETWQDWAIKQHVAEVEIAAERGPVLDRNGKLLAVSVPAESVYVRPKQVKDKDAAARELAVLLEMKPASIREKLSSNQPFVWIKRQVPRYQVEKVASLSVSGRMEIRQPPPISHRRMRHTTSCRRKSILTPRQPSSMPALLDPNFHPVS